MITNCRIIIKVLAFVAFVAAGVLIMAVIGKADDALAQEPRCRPLAEVKQHFAEKYREKLIGRAMSPHGPLAIFSSPDGRTFTVFAIVGDQACIVLIGSSLQIEAVFVGEEI
jgi:hypothetical protein